ncbi:hypothetical protein [Streptomyces exfoliatus]|uniref:hypothetical protein n=1 Tax=Streptomyces exfoliatus TaxID=1905 RepID=UPI0012FF0D35|nr:hypothetical protein [Streptomyces exfoliatus]
MGLVNAGAAEAAGCAMTVSYDRTKVLVNCTNVSQYRAVATCVSGNGVTSWTAYGPWKYGGDANSIAVCNTPTGVINPRFEVY